MDKFNPFLVSALIGLIVGFERQKSQHEPDIIFGLRSFLLISLLGAFAGWVNNALLAAVVAFFVFALILISYLRSSKARAGHADLGITTEMAAGLVFLLGYVSHFAPAFAALMGPLMALVLFSKKPLHEMTEKVKEPEFRAVLLILLIGAGVISLLPDQPVDPWHVFNPKKYGLLIWILALFEFGGYLLTKFLDPKRAFWIMGLIGGIVSSTAITVFSARKANKETWHSYGSAVLSAQAASLAQLIFILSLVSTILAGKILVLLFPAFVFVLLGLIWCVRKSELHSNGFEIRSPLDLKNVLKLSFLLGLVLFCTGLLQRYFGESGIQLGSFLAGFFELHAVSLGLATTFSNEQINFETASRAVVLAIIGSFLAKIGISWIFNRGPFSRFITLMFFGISILTGWIYHQFL